MLTSFDQINTNIIKKYLYICNKNINFNNINEYDDMINYVMKIKLNLSIYNKLNNQSIINSLLYMFNHISSGIFVKIQNNKLEAFIPFENKYFKNNWSNNIKLDSANNNSLFLFKKNRNKYIKRFNKYIDKIIFWHCNANIINNEEYNDNDGYIPHSINDYYDLIKETLNNYKINDVTIFINKRDSCILHKD